MELTHIKDEVCSICGSGVTSEERRNQHCSGEWNESRMFSCGGKLEYSPNLREVRPSAYHTCSRDPVIIKRNNRRKVELKNIQAFVAAVDADPQFIADVLDRIKHVNS